MSSVAIKVQEISKRYRLGEREPYKQLKEVVTRAVATYSRAAAAALSGHESFSDRLPSKSHFWALKDVSFEVRQGEVLGIIGMNGAGKSTLLKILSRITRPTSGRALVYGRLASLLEVGTGFHPELTGQENIYFNGAILGMRRAEIDRKFDEIVAFAEVERFIDTPVKFYSSGMYLRLAFAVAAHLEPEILLVDEILAVGDAAFQKKCLGKMGEVAGAGRTVLFVSHNMAAVRQLTQTCLLLQDGMVEFLGPTERAVAAYLDSVTELSKTAYQVESVPRRYPHLSKRVQLVHLELEGRESQLIPGNANVSFLITVKGNESVEKFRFRVTVFRFDGTPIGSAFSLDRPSLCKNEIATYRLTFQNLSLAPGTYYCTIATGKGNHHDGYRDFDLVPDVLFFEILPLANVDGTMTRWLHNWGNVQFGAPSVRRIS